MTREQADDKAREILNKVDLTKEDIDAFYDLGEYIPDPEFGGLAEALIAIVPPELLQYI